MSDALTPRSVDLARTTAQGALGMLTTQGVRFTLSMTAMVVMARLLTPADFGLIAMTTPIVAFAALFKDLGFSAAVIQRDRISHRALSSLFWLNCGFGLLLSLICFALAPLAALFYGSDELVLLLPALSLILLLGSISAQQISLLRREMRFFGLAIVQIGSVVLGAACGLLVALFEPSYWALAVQAIVAEIVLVVGCWTLSSWRPGVPRFDREVVGLIKFSSHVMASNLINYFHRNIDNLLIGHFWGAAALGFYSRAYDLLLLPVRQINTPLTQVFVPVLARLKGEPERYRHYYRTALGLVATIGMPTVALTAVAAEDLVALVLGDKWLDLVPIYRALAPAAFIGTTNIATGWVFLSWGNVTRLIPISLFGTGLVLAAFTIALPFGVVAMAWAYSLALCLARWPQIIWCFSDTPLRQSDFWRAIFRPALASLGSAAALLLFEPLAPQISSTISHLLLIVTGFCLGFAAIWLLIPGGVSAARDLIHSLRHLRPASAVAST